FSAHTASPPPPSRTPAGSRASSRHASTAPRTTSDGLPQITAHELRVPIDLVQGARHDVLLCRVDRASERFHPIRPRSRRRRPPPPSLHHFVRDPAKEEGIGLRAVLDRVTSGQWQKSWEPC